MEQQLTDKQIKAEQQRVWYQNNKEKVQEKKQSWYATNRDRLLKKNKELRDKKRAERLALKEKGIIIRNEIPKFVNNGLSFFEILDVLRKDNRHYLWGKSVTRWTDQDWFNFMELKENNQINQIAS